MRIAIKVVPGAKTEKIEVSSEGNIKVWVRAKPKENEANFAVINLLADHFKVSKSQIRIVSGLKSRNKLIEMQK